MTLPQYSNARFFSATLSNAYTKALLDCYDWAIATRTPFQALPEASTGTDLWRGFLLYTGDTDTFRYRFYNAAGGGATLVKVNGSTVVSNGTTGTQSGTVSLSGLGLTPDTIYTVTVSRATGDCDPRWLGLSRTLERSTPPTFSNGNVLLASQMNTLRTCILELEEGMDMPHTPNAFGRKGAQGIGNGVQCDGTPQVVWRGYFYHVHNTLKYKIQHGTSKKKVKSNIYYNGVDLVGTDLEEATHDHTVSGTYSLAGLGLTRGNFYECYTTVSRTGTSGTVNVFQYTWEMAEVGAASQTPPPVWAHGGQNVNATNLTRYSTIIDDIHPRASSPTAPLYYEQPAIQQSTSYRYYIQHRRKWLRYRPLANKTVEIYYGPNQSTRLALPSTYGNQSYDMSSVPGLTVGQYYLIEDVEFALETSTKGS